ncbi:Ubiquitin-conjugating enzyme, E2 [Melia azedarach]|uniref:Ubiquitin-conjugating enzyme, E2 n=1 Tax=Melia azedarach TaxID=155640 RepID=A0ACC1YE43_MELAZ|nr:Ubiquitin-conjugating enzyme, E2 [Melia azedarach]
MAEDKYNLKNPAVKRILQEVKEMQSNPSDDFMSLPLEENIFEWQFAISGPRDTEFEGGIYHGRIQLPAEYPFKPPSFMLLTPNGRFETQTKICLSISNHHPEHWQPSWSEWHEAPKQKNLRTALVALIAFMPTNPNGALGSLDYKKEERRALAVKSREAAPRFGTPERQKLIDEIHEYMLSKAPPVPQLSSSEESSEEKLAARESEAQANSLDAGSVATEEQHPVSAEVQEVSANTNPQPTGAGTSRDVPASSSIQFQPKPKARVQKPADDRILTWAAVGLTIAILVLLLKKFMKSNGHGAVFMNGS